ncbi:MAG: FAD binding domain-containing protein [Deltaproteobacteria bacterium]|nr:FAD binding domain-containing protein [Deltaproteobacteria bacterium]
MKTWKKFAHVNAGTVDEAASILKAGKAAIIAGGTDILGTMRFEILPDYPEILVNIKTISDLDYIKEESGMLRIGALTRLEDIAKSDVVSAKYTALAEAAHRTASPHIREMGTIGGNICQLTRCWYFRNPDNRFNCLRKGGRTCYAMAGDNRYHSIFGAVKKCLAVNPSDTAPALVALNARIKTNKRLINAEQFWDVAVPGSTILDMDEIVTEIQVPTPTKGMKSSFIKFAIRKSIDFPIVNCAAMVGKKDARICLNAVHNKPYRALKSEELIKGKSINEKNADAAGAAAVEKARALPGDRNKWKIQIARTMVKRAILACA